MELSKTTLNFAEKRNLDLFINDEGVLDVSLMDDEGCTQESIIQYTVGEDGLHFVKQFDDRLEDMPNWIQNEIHLREVLTYIAEAV